MGDRVLLKSYGGGDRIVKKIRNAVWIADENGNVTKFVAHATPLPKPTVARATPRRIPAPTNNTHKIEQLVSSMPKCTVALENMSLAAIEKKVAQLERNRRIRIIENKMKNLSFIKIARAVHMVIQNEPNLNFNDGDDLDLSLVSDDTLSKLQQFVCSNGLPIEQLIQEPKDLIPFSGHSIVNVVKKPPMLSSRDDTIQIEVSTFHGQSNIAFFMSRKLASIVRDLLYTTPHNHEFAGLDWINRNDTIKIKINDDSQEVQIFHISRDIFEMLVRTYNPKLLAHQAVSVTNLLFDERTEPSSTFVHRSQPDDLMVSELVQLFQNDWFLTEANQNHEAKNNAVIAEDKCDDENISMDFDQSDDNHADISASDTSSEDGTNDSDLNEKLYRLYHGNRDNA